ncbi:MFS-type Multidrug transporter [Penicillium ucsense]|uniref:MFS-type Multidrug transporter n=1 Tax=Penicillium ucsense TaxID=2839758 RepID=A0A8J8W5N6_9EURO|nr:MFS-type Multidrug transporter [Penicillium ucsense]KAF7739220.1 MFS-type Multidrug transporter [Penicillium ucsense]
MKENRADTASIDGSTPATSNREVYDVVADDRKSFHQTASDLERGVTPEEERQTIEKADEEAVDPNIVDWDGPDDPENPLNWTKKRKVVATVSIALITLLTPLGSSMFAPGVSGVVHDFNVKSVELSSFVVSVYLVGYCFGPLLIAPVSEIVGRRIVYNCCNFLYVVFTITCAVAPDIGSLTFFRFLAGFAGSCPLTIGAGSIADMFVQEHRGGAMAAWALGPLVGPVVGPVAGGYLSQAKGWRWTFWVLAMASGFIFVLSLFTIRESYAPTLLAAKTKKLRKETGNENLRSVYDTGRKPMDLFMFSIVRPTKMLFMSPIVFLLSLYVGIIYGYLYLLFTTISAVFEGQYGWSQGSVGLSYLGIGIGSFIGLFILGATSDRLLHYLAEKKGGMKPEYRLPPMIPGSFFVPISLFFYGWSAYYKTHWIVPIIGTSFLGIGMLISFMTVSTYLVDAFTTYAASAMAANTVFRSLAGALLPLAGPKMYERLGLGWGNSLLGFIALAMCPLPVVFYLYGERIRTSKRFQVDF